MRTYTLNEDYFTSLNPENTYWMGFIVGDGCVSDPKNRRYAVSISLKEGDFNHLVKFKHCIDYGGDVKIQKRNKLSGGYENASDTANIAINSKKLHGDLLALGVGPRKSLTQQWPTNIPDGLMPHYIRGIVDADGSIYMNANPHGKNETIGLNICGPREFLEGMRDWVNEHILPKDRGYIREKKIASGSYYYLVYSGNDCVLRILSAIYDCSTEDTRLDRKYQAYMDFKNSDPKIVPMRESFNRSGKSVDKYQIEAFGEVKGITEWAQDDRCCVSRPTLYRRLVVLGMEPEKAIVAKRVASSNVGEGKRSNAQKATKAQIKVARVMHKNGAVVADIAEGLGLTEACVHDIVSNKTFHDEEYSPVRKKGKTIEIEFNGEVKTIREWSEALGIAYSTIDRRLREGLPVDQVLAVGRKKGWKKAKSARDEDAHRVAQLVRQDYLDGIVGKANYEKHGIPKSRYVDLIGNRTCKEEATWWKG